MGVRRGLGYTLYAMQRSKNPVVIGILVVLATYATHLYVNYRRFVVRDLWSRDLRDLWSDEIKEICGQDLWSRFVVRRFVVRRFVVRRDWNFARSGEPATTFLKF